MSPACLARSQQPHWSRASTPCTLAPGPRHTLSNLQMEAMMRGGKDTEASMTIVRLGPYRPMGIAEMKAIAEKMSVLTPDQCADLLKVMDYMTMIARDNTA